MSESRNRAWRRFKDRVKKGKDISSYEIFKREKNWKLMYFRKNKLARAKQLGFGYPVKSQRQLLDQEIPSDEQ